MSSPGDSQSVYSQLRAKGVNCSYLNRSLSSPAGCWKITNDSSIRCSPTQPNCRLVEIVSPILQGGDGLQNVHRVLQILKSINPSVNKSMGVHVHIGTSQFSYNQLVKICQQFIKYEETFDLLVAPSRRGDANRYALSNRNSSALRHLSNFDANQEVRRCRNMDELINVVSPTRYFKLNLHAFRRHGTLEFRQHSATTNYMKVGYWIRLLVAFVNNAARLPPPKSFKASYGSDDHKMRLVKLNMMFQWLVKDGALKKHYIRRANFLSNNNRGARDSQDACCDSCASSCSGHTCRSSSVS